MLNFDQVHLVTQATTSSSGGGVQNRGVHFLRAALHVVITAQPIRLHIRPLVHGNARVFIPHLWYPMLLGDHVYGYLHAVHRK